jgi:hypothetical protein
MRSGSPATTMTSIRRTMRDESDDGRTTRARALEQEARMSPTTRQTRIAAATLAVLALAAPAATARPMMEPPANVPAEPAAAPPIQAADESFDWGSAGIGAAAAGLVLVAAGGFGAAHRGRARLAP